MACFAVFALLTLIHHYQAERFYESIADLNWTDLHVGEQKMIRLLLLRAQRPITLRPGGLFYLDRPLITQVFFCWIRLSFM